MALDVRGPRLGDSASLWNFTPSPGWTKDQVAILRLALMKYGVGRWIQILDTGLLPGKLIQQLNGQTQRLLGQQSLAAYTGLHVNIDRIRADNEANKDALRKSGLIIWEGPNPTKQMKAVWQVEAQAKYGLTTEQKEQAGLLLQEYIVQLHEADSILPSGMPLQSLDKAQKLELLRRLRRKLQSLSLTLEAPTAALGINKLKQEESGGRLMQATEQMGRGQQQARPKQDPSAKSKVVRLKSTSTRPSRRSKRKRRKEYDSEDSIGSTEIGCELGRENEDEKLAVTLASRNADIEQLEAMGFSRAKSMEAMQECRHNVDMALDWLLCSCT